MTYRDAQRFIEQSSARHQLSVIEQLIYQGGHGNDFPGDFRNWDDEISDADRELLLRAYDWLPALREALTLNK
jgi:hypothetical protein